MSCCFIRKPVPQAAGVPMLDPTGRLPTDPSSAVVAKTRAFGTGRAPPTLLDKMSLRHPDVRPKDLLLPSKYREREWLSQI